MKITGIFHVGVTVSDLERSVAFYRDVLGMELVGRGDYLPENVEGSPPPESMLLAYLRLRVPNGPGHHLELVEYLSPKGTRGDPRACNPGNLHIAFTVDDIMSEYRDLKAKGVRFKSEPYEVEVGGTRSVYFLDPDDITLELVQRKPTPAAVTQLPPTLGR